MAFPTFCHGGAFARSKVVIEGVARGGGGAAAVGGGGGGAAAVGGGGERER